MPTSWEDSIALGNGASYRPEHIGRLEQYLELDDGQVSLGQFLSDPIEVAAARDTAPLPSAADREGYYGPNHFNYWASGFSDMAIMRDWFSSRSLPLNDYLDIGCASGRVLRHFAAQMPQVNLYGCDINRQHVDWCNAFLPAGVKVFQNTSLPHLPLADESLDLISAFSVFTHIEAFDTSWIMELHRILRPGGIAWLTIHGDRTWSELKPTWPLHAPLTSHPDYAPYKDSPELPEDRLVFRWNTSTSYSANVFYTYAYIRQQWGRILQVEEIMPCVPPFQDVVVLRKR